MNSLADLVGTITISEQVRGGMEPAATTILRVEASGFHDAGTVGRSGQESGVIDIKRVADLLTDNFKAAPLRDLLSHFVRLHDELASR